MMIPVIAERLYLRFAISKLRRQMILIGSEEGLTSEETIRVSQKLDTFIIKYQILNDKGIKLSQRY